MIDNNPFRKPNGEPVKEGEAIGWDACVHAFKQDALEFNPQTWSQYIKSVAEQKTSGKEGWLGIIEKAV